MTDHIYSQRQIPRSHPRLGHHFNDRLIPSHDLQQHAPAPLHTILLRLWDQTSRRCRKLPHKSHIHRRYTPLPSQAPDDRKAILPANNARSAPMPAAVSNQRQRPPRFHQYKLGNGFCHRRGGTRFGCKLYHRVDYNLRRSHGGPCLHTATSYEDENRGRF